MTGLDFTGLSQLADRQHVNALFVTVSGAHLYGFPSPNSDVDLRGCHLLPLAELVGLDPPTETVERKLDHCGIEVEWVSHDLGKFLRLLAKNNGYVLEQIFSPLVVTGQAFLDELRPLAHRCITRHHYHHYRGFLATQRRLLERQEPKLVKTVLYAYRVALTGIHLLRTGEVEAHLPRLAERYDLPDLAGLIERKVAEKAAAVDLDWSYHDARLCKLEESLAGAYRDSRLAEDRDRAGLHRLLVRWRLAERRDG